MNPKIISLVLAWVSAAGILYFAFDTLTSLGDWGRAWSVEPFILIFAIIVSVVPACASLMGIILIEQSQKTRDIIKWFLIATLGSWAWLYIGTIILGVMRLQ
jgi:hypothetical protein